MSQRFPNLTIEDRRPGLWIVAAGRFLFTIDYGQDPITMDRRFRVTTHRGKSFDCGTVLQAFSLCDSLADAPARAS